MVEFPQPINIGVATVKTETVQSLKQKYSDLGAVVFGYQLPNGRQCFPQLVEQTWLNYAPSRNLVSFIEPPPFDITTVGPYELILYLRQLSITKRIILVLHPLDVQEAPPLHPLNVNKEAYVNFTNAIRGFDHFLSNVQYYTPQRKTLMVVGWLGKGQEAHYLVKQLEHTWNVITVATDIVKDRPDPEPNSWIFDECTENVKRECMAFKKAFPMKLFCRHYKPDLVYIRQTDLALDWSGCDEYPKVFHCSEGLWPDWPYMAKNVIGFVYSFYGAYEQYLNIHRFEARTILDRLFLPYYYSPEQYPPIPESKYPDDPHDKTVFFGFMGSTGLEGQVYEADDPRGDQYEMHVRDLRRRFIQFAVKELGLEIHERGSYVTRSDDEYADFASRCNLFLNVSSPWGGINQRQYHIPAMGPVLVQWRYKGIEDLGFKDLHNCLLFSDEAELAQKIAWAKANPIPLEQIRTRGLLLALKNTDKERGLKLSLWMLQTLAFFYAQKRSKLQ